MKYQSENKYHRHIWCAFDLQSENIVLRHSKPLLTMSVNPLEISCLESLNICIDHDLSKPIMLLGHANPLHVEIHVLSLHSIFVLQKCENNDGN